MFSDLLLGEDTVLCVFSAGIKLTGGIGSKWQGIYCLEVVPGSPASEEGTVKPNDKILYISGRCTLGMTLEDAVKACEVAPRKVKLKIIRYDDDRSDEDVGEVEPSHQLPCSVFEPERTTPYPQRPSGTVRIYDVLGSAQVSTDRIVWWGNALMDLLETRYVC